MRRLNRQLKALLGMCRKEKGMEWHELYEKLLNVARAEMGSLTDEDEAEFKRLFYHGLHDWVSVCATNYQVEQHNKLEN